MIDYEKEAAKLGKLVKEKQAAYGDSFGKSEQIFKILYPDGVKPENYRDFLTLVRIVDKMFRIATKKDAFGENPFMDIQGYALLAAVKDVAPLEPSEPITTLAEWDKKYNTMSTIRHQYDRDMEKADLEVELASRTSKCMCQGKSCSCG